MKNIVLLLLISPFFTFSQNINKYDDFNRITLNVLLPDDSKIPSESKDYFISKLNQIVTHNGLSGTDISNPRFILSGSINELNNEQLSESLLFYYNLDIVLYILDLKENKIYNSLSIGLKGVGNTKLKAYADCIKRIDSHSKEIKSFLETGKNKILNYYTTQCDFIQSKAKNLAKLNKYDEAIYDLSLIPDISEVCYNTSMANIVEIYKAKINYECRQSIDKVNYFITLNRFDEAIALLSMFLPNSDCYKEALILSKEIKNQRCSFFMSKARAAWASNNIEDVSTYLSEIPSDSKCNSEALKLVAEVKKVVMDRDKREWDLKFKIQNEELEIRKATINAAKEIGVSFGKSQPKTVIYHNFKTFW